MDKTSQRQTSSGDKTSLEKKYPETKCPFVIFSMYILQKYKKLLNRGAFEFVSV
jgi:hypothetical protein